MRNPWTDRY